MIWRTIVFRTECKYNRTFIFNKFSFKNYKKYCKPVSRILFSRKRGYHLSGSNVADRIYLSTHEHQASNLRAFTYLTFQHVRFTHNGCYQPLPWALTSHFHPYLPKQTVIFCGTFFPYFTTGPSVRWYVALYCPDFPPHCWSDNPACSVAKIHADICFTSTNTFLTMIWCRFFAVLKD